MRTSFLLAAALLSAAPGRGDDKPAKPEDTAKAFVKALAAGDFARATERFDAVMKKVAPANRLEAIWKEEVTVEVGPFKKVVGTRREKVAKYEVVYVTCEFAKFKLDARVVFDGDKITGFSFRPAKDAFAFEPPPYARRDSFRETEVVVGTGEWKLPGTLTLPKGDGPFPAVVLLHGSGPHDRDETIGPNKPLRDLAWGLASRGVASVRYEKRTHAHSARLVKMPDKVTLKEEVVDDALAAAALLRKTDKIDPKRVFVVGHSLGAVAAPRVAELDPGVAGIVLMAGNQRPLEVVMLEQIDYILSLEKSLTPAKKKLLTKMREQVTRLRTLKPGDAVKEGDLPDGAGAGYWLALKAYDQSATAAKVRQPVLVLQGERDYQVSMADFAGWKKALAAKKNARLKSYPDLNHLFMTGKGKATPEEYARPGHVAEKVVDDIAVWVKGK